MMSRQISVLSAVLVCLALSLVANSASADVINVDFNSTSAGGAGTYSGTARRARSRDDLERRCVRRRYRTRNHLYVWPAHHVHRHCVSSDGNVGKFRQF